MLHAAGLRFRIHVRELPGTPDIGLPRHRTVVFVHGCFWHGHHCMPWIDTGADQHRVLRSEDTDNRARDKRKAIALRGLGGG